MKKGFTLVELLAVIVILAIIALIAVPVVLDIIDSSKVNAEKRSKELYIDAAQQAIARKNLTNEFNPISCTIDKSGNLDCNGIILTVETEGERPCQGNITFKNGKVERESINFSCEPIPAPVSFKEDSWETIIGNVRLGNTSVYENNVGDDAQVKELTLKGAINGTFKVRIANATTPDACNTPGFSQTACGFVIEFVDIITKHGMNTLSTNKGGWPNSELYQYLENEIYNSLPKEIRKVIIPTKVISGHGLGDTTGTSSNYNYETTNDLYLLSPMEVWGSNPSGYDTAANSTRQLDYYAKVGVTANGYSKEIKYFNGSEITWWLRSARSNSNTIFCAVGTYVGWRGDYATAPYGVSPAFRIG